MNLIKRKVIIIIFASHFFFIKLESLTYNDITIAATDLHKIYHYNIDLTELINKCLHLKSHLINIDNEEKKIFLNFNYLTTSVFI